MKISEKEFNRRFNALVLIGMSVALVVTTVLKLSSGNAGNMLLLVSALGSLMGILATVSSANGKTITFLFGFLDVAIYGSVCLVNWLDGGAGLGNALLHYLYFVPMQFVGFFQWRNRTDEEKGKVRSRRLDGRGWGLCAGFFIIAGIAAYCILAHFDRSADTAVIKTAVILDVLPLLFNLIGQMLMSLAYAEQWVFWIGVNITSIAMWTFSLTTGAESSYAAIYIVKYSFYLINSVNGLRLWLK